MNTFIASCISVFLLRFKALHYALSGLYWAYKSQIALRIELFLVGGGLLFVWLSKIPVLYAWLLISALIQVVVIELVNTAIEVTIDRIGKERNELSKIAKDCGAAAVLVALTWACIVFCACLWQMY